MLLTRRFLNGIAAIAVYAISFAPNASAELPYNVSWAHPFGTASQDSGGEIAVDSGGNAYVTGTFGNDGYLNKFDASGNLTWSRIISSADYDGGHNVTIDSLGNAYAAGITWGNLYGPSAGQEDVFVIKYDPLGNTVWSRQYGTAGHDYPLDIAVDQSGNSYINGTPNAFVNGSLTKLNPSGGTVWTRQIPLANSIATDSLSNVFAVGDGGGSGFLTKYDSNGSVTWTRSIDTPEFEQIADVVVDTNGNAYITGHTQGSLTGSNYGGADAFVIKYDPAGNVLWTRQIGSPGFDYTNAITMDGIGNLYIAGVTDGAFATSNTGGDTFIVKYNLAGNFLWAKQLNTGGSREISGPRAAASSSGDLHLAGTTYGNILGAPIGDLDAYLLKLSPVPEPSSLVLLATAAAACLCRGRKQSKR